jgi:hypothetical protein
MVAGRWVGVAMLAVVSGCPGDASTTGGDANTDVTTDDDGPPAPDTGPVTAYDTTMGLSDEGSSEGEDPEVCPPSHACIAPAPAGWLGPVALVGNGGDACPDEYPVLEVDAFTEIAAAPALCSCECDTSPLCGALVGSDLESACTFPTPILDSTLFAEPEVCTAIPAIDGAGLHLAFEPDPAGSCLPTGTVGVPTPTPADRVMVCNTPLVASGCAGGDLCIPAFAEDSLHAPCIARTGAHECPPNYPIVQSAFTSTADDRGCSPCECTAPDGVASCNANVRLSSTDDCSDQVVPDADVGVFTCIETAGLVLTHLQYAAIDTYVGGCEPSGGLPMGAAEPAEPITICCAG